MCDTGSRAGDEVVQLYLRDVVEQVARPVRQLAGFARVRLGPGADARVRFRVHADRTAFTGRDLGRLVEPGDVEILVGASSADLPCTATVRLTGPLRTVGTGRQLVTGVDVTRSPGGQEDADPQPAGAQPAANGSAANGSAGQDREAVNADAGRR